LFSPCSSFPPSRDAATITVKSNDTVPHLPPNPFTPVRTPHAPAFRIIALALVAASQLPSKGRKIRTSRCQFKCSKNREERCARDADGRTDRTNKSIEIYDVVSFFVMMMMRVVSIETDSDHGRPNRPGQASNRNCIANKQYSILYFAARSELEAATW